MRKVIFVMGVSLDGFVADRDGGIDWTVPSEELHRFHNERMRVTGVELYGRRLYETMRYWDTPEAVAPDAPAVMREFAEIWRATPSLVFSRTLDAVEGTPELASGDPADVVAELREQDGGDITVGGPGLAAGLIERGLVDEYHLFVYPVVLGGGTPFFPALDAKIDLELAETRTFGEVVYLRYVAR